MSKGEDLPFALFENTKVISSLSSFIVEGDVNRMPKPKVLNCQIIAGPDIVKHGIKFIQKTGFLTKIYGSCGLFH